MIDIRDECVEDHDSVRNLNNLAFEAPGEGRIVDKLREICQDILSLVAVCDGQVVGHILFSPAQIKHGDTHIVGMGLAPMAVLPEFQKQGIGSMLVKEGLRRLKPTGCPFIIVLGHEHYYPRFGFERASTHGLKPQWDEVPDDAFMVMILDASAMADVSGVAAYRDEFDAAM